MNGRRTICALSVLLLWPLSAGAQEVEPTFDLTVADIMRGPEHVGAAPRGVEWTDDGRWVYFQWKPGGRAWDEDRALYRVSAAGGEPERLPDDAADSLRVLLASGDVSPDERRRVVSHRGDLYTIERASLDVEQLTDTRAAESDPVFGRDGRTIFFVRDDNVFERAPDGMVRQRTDIRTGPEPEEAEAEGQREVIEEQQKEIFEHIRRELDEEKEREARREARRADEPETVYLDPDERVSGIAVDPAGRFAVLEVGKRAEDAQTTLVPDYVTETGYTENLDARAKVGDAQREARIGLVDLATGAVGWLDVHPDDGDAEDERLARVRFLGWTEDGDRGLIASVGYDFKDQWLFTLDPETGALDRVAHDHDDAWIGGPCSTWTRSDCAGWMPGGESVFFLSERDGYSHLYVAGRDGGEPRQLTRGEWEVKSVEVAPDEDRFYLTTSEASPFERHVYHMPLDGGARTRITGPAGHHSATPSPHGDRLAVVHSSATRPPELFLMRNEPGAAMERVTTSPTEEWRDFGWVDPEIIRFEARDGVEVPARIYRPGDVGAEPNGAAVIFVHGAGYLHNVHRGWSSYYREYMFHHVLASRGYTVLDIDYRGSAGYGRDWRTAIYRHMGGKDLTDQVDGARHLVREEGIDPDRIGIYGGSYGGFITLMALFKHPETFAGGAALRSVTDWAHYNHWYTGRILNLPQQDEEAYRRSSPIYFAEGLEDPLLIAHGMVDTNVHFQDVVRLAQRLIELGKTDWEMAVYPVEGHGFDEPSSWADEYRRILELFERSLADRTIATEDE